MFQGFPEYTVEVTFESGPHQGQRGNMCYRCYKACYSQNPRDPNYDSNQTFFGFIHIDCEY